MRRLEQGLTHAGRGPSRKPLLQARSAHDRHGKRPALEQEDIMAVDVAKISVDQNRAESIADQYIEDIKDNIEAKKDMLNVAIRDFADFVALPPSESAVKSIFEAAFAILSTAIPAFKIAEKLKEYHDRAEVALKAAEAFGQTARRADKIVKAATKGAQRVGEGAKYVKEGMEIKEKVEKVAKKEDGEDKDKAHFKPVLEIIRERYEATRMWKSATAAVQKVYENRMNGLQEDPKAAAVSLESQMRGLLPSVTLFSDSDLAEIRLFYLNEMIKKHVATKPVYIIRTITEGWTTRTSDEIKGWNDTQRMRVGELFGRGTARLTFLIAPLLTNVYV
jgi:hypothetical protein